MEKIAVISLSGGMDSTSLLIKLLALKYRVFGISFDYGQKHKHELKVLQNNIDYLKSKRFNVHYNHVNISDIQNLLFSSLVTQTENIPQGHYKEENMKNTVVPNRNSIFSSISYAYALSLSKKYNTEVKVFLGVHSGDHHIYPDCTKEFYTQLSKAFSVGNYDSEKVSFNLPFIDFNKTDILKDCILSCNQIGVDYNYVLSNTLTSYNSVNGISTGTSGSDIERIEAFINLGIQDPIQYDKPWSEIVRNAKKILKI